MEIAMSEMPTPATTQTQCEATRARAHRITTQRSGRLSRADGTELGGDPGGAAASLCL